MAASKAAAEASATTDQRIFLGKSMQHFKGSVDSALLEGELVVLDVHDWDSRVGIALCCQLN